MLNLVLLAGWFFLLTNQRKSVIALSPTLSAARPVAPAIVASFHPDTAAARPVPFCWNQLASVKDYRTYVNNLRASGCPEATIEDIVRGDADRAFSWERNQLGLDGSGAGPWSQAREMQLVASLLDGHSVETAASVQNREDPMENNKSGDVAQGSMPLPGTTMGAPAYPLFLQNANWNALGFTADQQAVIAQVRQQFQNEIGNLNENAVDVANQNPDTTGPDGDSAKSNSRDPAVLTHWQKALQNANNQLRDLLGAQGYMAYEQQQYYAWYQPQVETASAQGEQLTINPDEFSLK